jgi:hypothetical protein
MEVLSVVSSFLGVDFFLILLAMALATLFTSVGVRSFWLRVSLLEVDESFDGAMAVTCS